MKLSSRLLAVVVVLALASIGACQEDLVAPGLCPEFCPEGTLELVDTVLFPVGRDSAFRGFVLPHRSLSIHAISRVDTLRSRVVLQFIPYGDSVVIRGDTTATRREVLSIDSIRLSMTLLARDTLGSGLELSVYALPPGRDSTDTFASLDGEFVPANLLTTVAVDSQLETVTGIVEMTFDASTITFDSINAVALGVTASAQTGLPLATFRAMEDPTGLGTQTIARAFVTVDSVGVPARTFIDRIPVFDTSLLDPPSPPVADLEIGGLPSARSLLRFNLPLAIIDSATITRATLFLVPTSPSDGIPATEFIVAAHALLADLGQKSPLAQDTASALISVGSADTVALDIGRLAQLWQTNPDRPRAIMIRAVPEGGTVGTLRVGTSMTPGAVPSLRLVFFRPFEFGSP